MIFKVFKEHLERPRRRIVATFDIGADSWEDLACALRSHAGRITAGDATGIGGFSVNPSFDYEWRSDENRYITSASYSDALKVWSRQFSEEE